MQELLGVIPIFMIGFLLWLLVLSGILYKLYTHYMRLTKNAKAKDLMKVLDQIVDTQTSHKGSILKIEKAVEGLHEETGFHLSKVGLVRFNPFNETGGDQSFSLALLDRHDTGVVITGLHTRDRTRVYTKPVKAATSKYELSKEEQKAIREARKPL